MDRPALVAHLRGLMATRKWCYWVFRNTYDVMRESFRISIVVMGEAGHYPTGELDTIERMSAASGIDAYDNACAEAWFLTRTRHPAMTEVVMLQIIASAVGGENGGHGRPCFGSYEDGSR